VSEQPSEPEPSEPARATDISVEPEQPSEPPPESESDDIAAVRREAATYRRRLRDAEAERDALREQVDRRDRVDAERLAGQTMELGADLWRGDVQLADLRDEDGALSSDLVDEAVAGVLAARPHWRRRGPGFDGGARTTPEVAPAHPFGEALKQAGRP
jgi:hypothetical protein